MPEPLPPNDEQVVPTEGKKLTPQERSEAVEKIAREAKKIITGNISAATTEKDFLRWNSALLWSASPQMIDWMWDFGGITTEALIEDYETTKRDKEFEKEARYVSELREKLAANPDREGQVKVALKRIRDKSGRIENYRILAEFPLGYYVKGVDWEDERDNSKPHVIYFEPSNACVIHACDDLYRSNKGAEGVAYIPVVDYTTAIARLSGGEYMTERNDTEKVTQDTGTYVLVGLIGGFSNEGKRVRMSDFWNKQCKPTTSF